MSKFKIYGSLIKVDLDTYNKLKRTIHQYLMRSGLISQIFHIFCKLQVYSHYCSCNNYKYTTINNKILLKQSPSNGVPVIL